ncbi:MAG: hypothetical protein AB8G95_10935 [Anaerolineae bacterium]
MIQNQHDLLHLIAAGTINARDGVELLQLLKVRSKGQAKAAGLTQQTASLPVQTQSPHHTLSGKQMPWLTIQAPIQNL